MNEFKPRIATTPGRQRVPPPTEVPQFAYGWLLYVGAALAAILIAFAVFKLHYTYAQAPHRIVKMLVALAVSFAILVKPRFALHAWLLAIPMGEALPVTGIPGLNGPNLLFMLALVGWIIPRVIHRQPIIRRTRIAWPLAAFLFVMFLSFLRAALFPVAGAHRETIDMLKMLWQSVAGFSIYFVAANAVEDDREARGLLVTLGAGVSLAALLAMRQYALAPEGRRIGGSLGDPNNLGAYFAVAISLLLGLVIARGAIPSWRRLVVLGATALTAIAALLPKSRGGYVGAACGVGCLTFLTSRKLFVVFLILLAASPLWAPTIVRERMAETRTESVEQWRFGDAGDRLDPSAAVRLDIWGSVLRAFVRSPLIGHGYRSIPFLTYRDLGRHYSAHNLYVETAGETGIVGLAVLGWLIAAFIKSGMELLRRATSAQARGLASGFLAATAALLAANVFGQRFTHISIAGTYCFLAGLVDRSIAFERASDSQESAKGAFAS